MTKKQLLAQHEEDKKEWLKLIKDLDHVVEGYNEQKLTIAQLTRQLKASREVINDLLKRVLG